MKHPFFFIVSICAVALMSCTVKQNDYSNYVHSARIDSVVMAAVDSSMIPGAVVCVVEGNNIAYMKAYGFRQVWPDTLPMTESTQFDLASLSKVVGTGMSVMCLVDEGKVDLEAPMSTYLPDYQPYADADGNLGREQKVIDFLTHTSGLPAYASYKYLLRDNPDATPIERKALLREYMATCRRRAPAGTDCEYSCLNFISLQYMLESVTDMPLNEYAEKYVFKPLGMMHTCYYPLEESPKMNEIVAPTERKDSVSCFERIVHDPLAREMNTGVSGNAGVFSTAGDLAKLAMWVMEMVSKDDEMMTKVVSSEDGMTKNMARDCTTKGPFSAETLKKMVTVPEGYEAFGRALAWDSYSDYAWVKGDNCSDRVVCHTGYTGTSIVIDLEQQKALIVLTNRAHPNDGGGVSKMRRELANTVFEGQSLDLQKDN